MNSSFHVPAPAAESRFPLSFAQERMWFLYRLAPANASYHVGMALRCTGMLDAEGVHWALSAVVRRHDVLRTVFGEHEGIPYQRVDDSFDLDFEIVDSAPEKLSDLCLAAAIKPFCLESAPGFRAVLLRLSDHDHVLQITLHHIISDAWSINILLAETVQLYEAFLSGSMRSLPPLQIQYWQFAAEEHAALLKSEMESDLAYWRKQLEEMAATQLPADRTPPSGQTNLGAKLSVVLHSELFGKIQELGRKEGLTLFMVLVAGLQVVMGRWTAQEDITVGTAVANRKSAELEALIGLFVNTLVIRTSLSGNPTVRELCKRVRHVCLGAYAHQDLPFDSLVIELNPERNLKRNPLFQTMFTLENAPASRVHLSGLRLEPMVLDLGASAFDMALSVWEAKGRLEGWLEFNTGVFEAATMKRFWEHWSRILGEMTNDPGKEIANLEMLGQEEQRQILEEWGHGERVESTGGSLQSCFEEYVVRTPEAVAVQHGDRCLSYLDLERRTNQTANYLKRLGVGPEVLVGVCIQRSLDMVVILLGILKAGGAYVPLDPDYPEDRLAFMLEDTKARIVMTHTDVSHRIPAKYTERIIDLQQEWHKISTQSTDKPGVEVDGNNLAYVIYTSGSTGKPKGVGVPHRGVMRLIKCKDYTQFGADEVVLQFAPLAFDASTLEIWGSLLNGGRLAIMDAGPRTTQEIAEALSLYGVTMLWLTAGLFHAMVDDQMERLKQVRQVLAGGDVLSAGHVARYLAAMSEDGVLINGYGPTECTTFTCCHRMCKQQTTDAHVPIGRPIGNTQVCVLNAQMQPVGVGEIGELYIGGEGLARGYLNRPELTAEKFVPNNFAVQSGERLYRSGDLVRWQSDGTLQFIGRTDNQLKLRGYRIELGEIEAALTKISGVNEAAVIAVEGKTGDRLLVAYVAGNSGSLPSSAELRRHLQQWVPEYMIPSAFVAMEQLPLTANGKLDRGFLSRIDFVELQQTNEYVAPRTKTEELVSAIFCEVLGTQRVGLYDNFFHLGGHSLLASKVMLRLEETFQVQLPLARLFEAPTSEQLAELIDEMVRTSGVSGAPTHLLPAIQRVARQAASLSLEPLGFRHSPAEEVVFLPASFAQQRLWFLDQLTPGRATYNIDSALRIRGKLDVEVLERALQEVARRHETLRTRFVAAGGELQQVIEDRPNVQLPVLDLTGVAGEEEREAEAVRLAREEMQQPFDLQQAPLFRGKLLRLGEMDHVLLFTMHHIISDAWSMGVLVEEVSVLYAAFSAGRLSPLPELSIQYGDYSLWQRECLEGGLLEPQLAYWKQQLAETSVLMLPTDRPRPISQSQEGAICDFVIGVSLTQKLKKLAEAQGATLFMVLLAALQTLLYRYSGQDDIAVGTPIAGRRSRDTEKLIGFFINTLVMRGDLSGAPGFTDLMERTKQLTLEAYSHQDVPFEKLVGVLSPERNLGSTPLFQVMIVLQNAPQSDLRLGSAVLQPFNIPDNGTSKFDLLLQLGEDGFGKLTGSLQYSTDLFAAASISRLIGHYQQLLSGIVDIPTQSIDVLPLLTPNEHKQVIEEWNRTGMEYERQKCLPALLEEQARRTPEAIAVVSVDGQLTYAELNRKANRIGHYLRQLGVGTEDRVGICVSRGRDMVAGMIGILKAGGAYIPLDGSYPQERLTYMVEDAKAAIVLTQAAWVESFNGFGGRIVLMDKDQTEIERQSCEDLQPNAMPENIAYVIYTSGSTGKPKGVAITHRSAVVLLHWARQSFSAEELSGVLASTSICFDLSVFEIFVPLSCGGTVFVVKDALELASVPEHSGLKLVNTVPSAMRELVRLQAIPESVQTVNLAGEALTWDLVQDIFELGTVKRICNLYGPSEDTTYSTYAWLEKNLDKPAVPIGKPIANTQAYVVDQGMEPVPVGVPGELCLGGVGLARGYWGRGDLTAERFVPDRLSGRRGERLYRTGDLVRWLADGNLEYLGRLDHQVKIRGFRIEMGEIEAVLREHDSVHQAVVIAREDEGGDKRLVAYVVPVGVDGESDHEGGRVGVRISELREYLLGKLPEYMVPTAYVPLEKIPLTHNGKIDRKSLPEPDKDLREQEYVGPRNATEGTLCRLWQEVLRRERVGIHDNFFRIGGHSLMAAQVAARTRETFKVDILLRQIFESPTIAQLAAVIDEMVRTSGVSGAPTHLLPAIQRVARQAASLSLEPLGFRHSPVEEVVFFPASFAQQRLWFLDQLTPGRATYNIYSALRIRGKLDVEVLERALQEVARRHETLRTRFVAAGGELQQVIEDRPNVQLPVLDLTGVAGEEEREAEAVRLAREEMQQPFDLQQAPLFREKLLRLGEMDHVLLFTMHHIISDAWSMGVLVEEVSVLYAAFSAGRLSPLPELSIQYADYSLWQRECLEGGLLEPQLTYWKQQLAETSVLMLPTDRPRPISQSQEGSTCSFLVDGNLTQGLKRLAEAQGATLFMVLLAAFQTLLYRYSGQDDIAVGTPVAGRRSIETEKLIGFFINTLVLRGDLSGAPSFTELLQRTKEVTLGAYAHQDVPFEKLVGVLSPERNLGSTPLFQVMIVLQNAPQSDLRLGSAVLQPFNIPDNGTSKFDLLLQLGEDGTGMLHGALQYNTDVFEAATITRLAGHYSRLLISIVAAPQAPIHGLEILSGEERRLLLESFNSTATTAVEKTLSELFEEQVGRTPNAMAIRYEEESLSYMELNQRANQLGRHLRKFGVGPEMRVGICLERSLEMVVSILGVLKAGGAYVPLDPGYPQERLQFMVEDAQVAVLISQRALGERFSQNQPGLIFWEDLSREIEPCSRENVESGTGIDNAAYMIYTSGSTGRPKGVVVTHGNVARLMRTTENWFEFNAQDVWTMFHSYAFDFSVWELWGALLYGGRLVVIPYWVSRSPELFYHLVSQRGVTVLNQTPSAFQQFSREDEVQRAEGKALQLRLVIFGGEALEMSSLGPWFERHGDKSPRLVNMYGITETTVHVTYKVLTKEIAQENASVIGTPIPDLQLYILREMEPVPIGVEGEMYVGGAGLARGYWKRAELTAQRFVPHPFSKSGGERLYRTGDRGRYKKDGGIEYLGRADQQVKVRGHRIELGEIEAALEQHEGVKQAVVVVREDQPGEKRLVAYVVGRGERLDVGQMRSYLQARLPEYMVPGALVILETMPLTAHGKLDRTALPRPEWRGDEKKYVAPRNAVEEQLSRIWSEILRVERVGIRDNFFELGGDSILSIQILARARAAGLKIELPQLFTYQTIERLAQAVSGIENEESRREGTEPFSLIIEEDRRKLPEDVEDAYPLSRLQAGMLFHNEYNEGTPLYHNITSIHMRAPFEAEVFQLAVEAVTERHEILRTSFHISGYSQPLQCVHRTASIKVEVEDLRHFSAREQEEMLKDWQEGEKRRGFNVKHPGLLRFHIHRRTEESIQFSLTEHHAILDGWSVASFLTELFGCYFGLLSGDWKKRNRLKSRFRDFIAAEMDVVEWEEARRFWQQQLSGMEIAPLPWGKQQTPEAIMETLTAPIAVDTSEALSGWAMQIGIPLKSALLAAHMRVLSLITGQSDVITGITSNGRMEGEDAEQVLGLFLNSPPFRMQLNGGTWKDLVKQTAGLEVALLPYRRFPLADIQSLAGGLPLFEVSFNFVHFHVYRGLERVDAVEILGGDAFAHTNFPLDASFSLDPVQSGLQLVLGYNSSVVRKEQIEAIEGYYQRALKAMVRDPDGRYEIASLLSEQERDQMLYQWNQTASDYPQERCIHEFFEKRSEMTPHAVAVRYAGMQMTYRELNQRSSQLAHYLSKLGVGPEVRVGICVQRSLEMIVGLVGILKAGGTFVPLDPDHPQERLAYVLKDAQVTVLLVHNQTAQSIPLMEVRTVHLDEDWKEIEAESCENPPILSCPEDAAYVIYTSGSTGKPKGVVVPHRAICNLVCWFAREFHISDADRFLNKTSLSFDVSVEEIFVPLTTGARVVLAKPGGELDLDYLARFVEEEAITCLDFPPALLRVLLDSPRLGPWISVRLVLCGGEPVSAELVKHFYDKFSIRFVNVYGPTETTVQSTFAEQLQGKDLIHIGSPVANTQVYVLDERHALVPVGAVGELLIGGAGLARGYANRPELTAEKFVPNPFAQAPGERLYRTGDQVRWCPDGTLEFLGRIDHQVKLRGYRIELGEIESALESHPNVDQSVVLAREDQPGAKRLVAYVIKRTAAESPKASELAEYLKMRLPEYMVPAAFLELEKWPLSHNGKVDRKSLPQPDMDTSKREYVGPRNPIEQTLCQIWQEVLRQEPVGIHDDFFSLGGHSLLALQLVARIRESFKVEIPIRALFEAPTVGKMTKNITGENAQRPQLSPIMVSMQPHGTRAPLFFVHAVGGQVMGYAELSRELGLEQPFYGLQSPPADFFRGSDASIARMATLYIREIRTIQPFGPYLLGGWSMGGLVAWEMAHQLVKQGETIGLLALIDTASPPKYRKESDKADEASMLASFAIEMSRLVGKDTRPLATEFSLLTHQEQWKVVQEVLTSYGVLSPEAAHAEMAALLDVFTRNSSAANSYIASPNNQQIVFFRASQTPEHLVEPWTTLAGGVHFHSVPGDHFTILTQPTVRIIAGLLQEYILTADEQPLEPSPTSVEARL